MHDNLCYQYITGFCLRSEFTSKITQKCLKLHDSGKKDAYDKNYVYENDYTVLNEYESVIREVENKIRNKEKILELCSESYFKNENKNDEKIEKNIENKNIELKENDKEIENKNNIELDENKKSENTENIEKIKSTELNENNENENNKENKNVSEDNLIFNKKQSQVLLNKIYKKFTSNLENYSPKEIYEFHQFYAKILFIHLKSKQKIILKICKVCSHVYENNCEHHFHKKYFELREIIEMLRKKIETRYRKN